MIPTTKAAAACNTSATRFAGLRILTSFSILALNPVVSSSSAFLSSSCCMAPVVSSPAATSASSELVSYSAIISPCSLLALAINWANSLALSEDSDVASFMTSIVPTMVCAIGLYIVRQKNSTRQRPISIMSGNLSSFDVNN